VLYFHGASMWWHSSEEEGKKDWSEVYDEGVWCGSVNCYYAFSDLGGVLSKNNKTNSLY